LSNTVHKCVQVEQKCLVYEINVYNQCWQIQYEHEFDDRES